MTLTDFITAMPKVELHVHLEGATQPAALLKLAERHGIKLPADTVEGIRQWYTFTDFSHFLEIYFLVSECIRTPDDIELLTREFLQGQAAQNIRYSEVTYTPFTHYRHKKLAFADQLAAINSARKWAEAELGVTMNLVLDISRDVNEEQGRVTADWVIDNMGDGVVALGLGGPEIGFPPERHTASFERALAAGIPCVPHAGETEGPQSIWSALKVCDAVRIGHGVRCMEDPALVAELRERQIPLEVAPTSNICLKVFDRFENHALPHLLDAGLYVTLNSDDPPMFNTTLTDEFIKSADVFDLDVNAVEQLTFNALRASFLPPSVKAHMERDFMQEFGRLRHELLV